MFKNPTLEIVASITTFIDLGCDKPWKCLGDVV
jgi:hypothetical protein